MALARGSYVVTDADGHRWTLRFTTNALCLLEDEVGENAGAWLQRLGDGGAGLSLRQMRTVFRCALVGGGQKVTDEEAGDVIDALGGLAGAGDHLAAALQAAFPDSGDAPEGNPGAPA